MQFPSRVASFIRWHRRLIAACLAALVVAGIVQAATARPPEGEPVVALTRHVPAGQPIPDDALGLVHLPAAAISDDTLRDPTQVAGAQAAVALGEGQVLTQAMLLRGGVAAEGKSLVPIAVERPELRSLLAPGAVVRLVVALGDVPEVVCTARIATLPAERDGTVATARAGSGMVVVEVPTDVAPVVATLGQGGQLSVVLGDDGGPP